MPKAKKKVVAKKTAPKSRKKTQVKKRMPAKKTAVAKKKPVAKKKKAGGGGGLKTPLQPSAQLAAIVGNKPMPRTQVVKKLWDYIKRKDLQDQKNRRMINVDDVLRPVFGNKKQISMFEVAKLIGPHLS
ncbi:MAG: SWIB/MDM2 domain-containing protein [Pseudomonadota bacterium]